MGLAHHVVSAGRIYVPLATGLPAFMAVTRASDGWYRQLDTALDPDPDSRNGEAWASVGGNDIARFHRPNGDEIVGLLIEPARENDALNSQRIEDAYAGWNETGTVCTDNQFVAPDGTTTSELCEDDDGAAHEYIEQKDMDLGLTPHTFSILSRDISGNVADMQISTPAATSEDALTSGALWVRTAVTKTPTHADNCYVRLYPGNVAAGVGGLGACAVWQMQVEEGAYPTSIIPTENAKVTRAADVCTLTLAGMGGLIRPEHGRVKMTWTPGFDNTVSGNLRHFSVAANDFIRTRTTGAIQIINNGLNVDQTAPLTWTANSTEFIFDWLWDGGFTQLKIWKDGVIADVLSGAWTPPAFGASAWLGSSSAGSSQATGTFRDLVIG